MGAIWAPDHGTLTKGISDEDIQRITDWYLHDEALHAALADIVNAMLALDTTQVWGDGSTSISDGPRFLFPQRVLRRTSSHRLGDFALEFYTFSADNYAPFTRSRASARSAMRHTSKTACSIMSPTSTRRNTLPLPTATLK